MAEYSIKHHKYKNQFEYLKKWRGALIKAKIRRTYNARFMNIGAASTCLGLGLGIGLSLSDLELTTSVTRKGNPHPSRIDNAAYR